MIGRGPRVVEIKRGVFSRYPKKESGSWQELDRGGTRLWGRVHNVWVQWKVLFGPDRLSEALRGKVREMILSLAEAELSEVLAALPYERKGERRGYRNGKRERWVSTGLGATVIELPRARLTEGEQDKEWQSRLIERYQRRARSVDSALLGCYLSGANGRRIRGALSPLLRGAPLSKSAISRVVGRLQGLFTEWRQRSLKEEAVVFVYLDAIALRVRIANRVVSAPVLVALGVKADGQKAVLDLELLQSESGECWGGFVEGLVGRGLKRPRLVIIDGNKGLRAGLIRTGLGSKCSAARWISLEIWSGAPLGMLWRKSKAITTGSSRPSLWNKRGKLTENLS